MEAGQLRHVVTIQAPLGVLSDSGPVDIQTSVPAAVVVLPPQFQPREALALGGLQNQTIYTLTCRYREDVRPAYVLREECCTRRVFQILAIIPSDMRDWLDMTCVTNG